MREVLNLALLRQIQGALPTQLRDLTRSLSGVALLLALAAWLLALLPWLSAPLAHLVAISAILLGYLAWLGRKNRILAGGAIALAVLALLWRYLFWLVLALILGLAYGIWQARRPPSPKKRRRRQH